MSKKGHEAGEIQDPTAEGHGLKDVEQTTKGWPNSFAPSNPGRTSLVIPTPISSRMQLDR